MSKARDLADFISTGSLADGSLDIADVSGLQTAIDGKETADATILKDADIGSTILAPDGDGSSLTGIDSLPSQSGNADKVLTTNGSTASWVDAAGGGNVAEFTASGTLPNGKPVILKADGTVEVVDVTTTNHSASIPSGSETVFHSSTSTYIDISFDPNNSNTFVICYRNSNNYGAAIIGTVSGSSISFGSETVFYSGTCGEITCAFDPNTTGLFVVFLNGFDNSDRGRCIPCWVTGTSIIVGSERLVMHDDPRDAELVFDPHNAKTFLVAARQASDSHKGWVVQGHVTGSDYESLAEYDTPKTFDTQQCFSPSISFDPVNSGKFVIAYNQGNSTGRVQLGTCDSNGIDNFGSSSTFKSNNVKQISVSCDSTSGDKFVICYRDGSTDYGSAMIGTISNGSVTYGSAYTFNTGNTNNCSVSFAPNTSNKFVVGYKDDTPTGTGHIRVGTVSGTAISFGSEYTFNSGDSNHLRIDFDSNNVGKFGVAYSDAGNSNKGTAIIGQMSYDTTTTNLTTTNFLGSATEAYTNGQTASIALGGGLSTNQSGLTADSTYYVQPDGTLSTTAGSPVVEFGKAVNATTLLIKDNDTGIPSQTNNSGKVLTTDGSAVSWGNGGAWEHISTATASNTSSVVFSSGLSGYSSFVLIGQKFRQSGSSYNRIGLRLNEQTSNYLCQTVTHASSSTVETSSQTSFLVLGQGVSNDSSDSKANSFIAYIFGAESTYSKQVTATINYKQDGGGVITGTAGGGHSDTDELDHIEVLFPNTNIYGTFHLYGVKA